MSTPTSPTSPTDRRSRGRGALSGLLLPTHQRRSLHEVTDRLYLSDGDRLAKLSAFWTMIVISGVVATAGVLADSTATVIGAMIIAPMSQPIMGMAIAIVEGSTPRLLSSAGWVIGGAVVVVLLGAAAAQLLPGAADLSANSQITARTAPSLLDLVAAVATGLAGAVGLARRDVADVMPGVAIAISLVPPLAVVGVTLGAGHGTLALGALVLFLSNVLALVLAGTLVFTAYGYATEAYGERGMRRRRAYLTIGATLAVVLVPLGANTSARIHQTVWTAALHHQVDAWLTEHGSDARVQRVTLQGSSAVVEVSTDQELSPTGSLLADLAGEVPDGTEVVLEVEYGIRIDVGVVGVGGD